ncbi:alpha/beta fold hydrolase [Flavilitoribacter nigricans]|uniref:PDZ domain-containing protein n=1 Tax=Flavilitoribacter nigricans (strain ATCC 23147 / DSM 23189 / NBRC 102662 / NCIMB 1420 / SS-2) TaxID=1122177 RepID=A0A2D0NFL0_FLAN2|nr:alpha/beta fold hydrolase [Flavilitoribacter nigricans]PHN07275.1 hypothetical protein CRP01_06495 [Flavilitoribacter nigricans DSM 23189 = NBRC 102662]
MEKNHPTVYLFVVLTLFTFTLNAQTADLARKGSLGVRLEAMTETRAKAAGLEATGGAYISEVLPGGTGAALQLRAGDVLLSVNGVPTNEISEVVSITQTWRAGQPLRLKVRRDGKSISLSGNVQGKPMETSDLAEVIYGAVPFEGGKLRSIMHVPKADGQLPLVVFLQGFSCSSIDYYYDPGSPIRQLVDGLVERGFAVYRVEKPGVGDSEGSLDCGDIDYDTEVAAFDAAISGLADLDFIDQEHIFYFGHSLGGVTAPLLAARHHPRGVAVYGTVFESWYEYMQKVFRDQAYVRRDDWIRTEDASRDAQKFLAALFLSDQSVAEMAEDPTIKNQLDNRILDYDGDSRFVGRHYTFWRGLNAANPVQAWRDAGVETLAIYGEHDIHAINPTGAQLIAEMVNDYHPGKGKFVLLEGTEHAFARVPSMSEYVEMRRNGSFNNSYMAANFNKELVRIVADWMEASMRTGHKKLGKN